MRAYKYRINPTEEQKVLFAKTFGCCRFVYNWALNLKIEAYKQSFLCPQHCRVDFEKGTITIPKAKDIPAVLHRKFKGTVKTVTVSMTPSGKYFASVLVDTAILELPASAIQGDTALGIDLGIKSLAVCSDGRTFDNPKNLQRSFDRLKLQPQGQPSQDYPCTHARQPSAYPLHGGFERERNAA